MFTTGCSGPADETVSLMSAQTDADSVQTMATSSEEVPTGLQQIAYYIGKSWIDQFLAVLNSVVPEYACFGEHSHLI